MRNLMPRIVSTLLCVSCLAGCATSSGPRMDPTMAESINANNAEYLASKGIVPPTKEEQALYRAQLARERDQREQMWHESAQDTKAPFIHQKSPNPLLPTPPTPSTLPTSPTSRVADTGISGWDVLKAIVLLPVVIPILAIASYSRSTSVHCQSWTYKDRYHTSCY